MSGSGRTPYRGAVTSDPPITIVMRSFNEAWALRDTLPALQAQEYRNWELIVFDSGSTDGSVALIEAARPRHFIRLLPHDYNPSRVMNEGMELAQTERVIFLNADATPQGPNWLRPLVEALADPQTAAVFGRQISRPDCAAVFAHDYERCFGLQRESARWDHFFSMVSSGLRKDVWARRGFLESMQYSEDDEYTRWCRDQGYRIAYCPDSVVQHSHNYTPRQAYKRSFGEAWALAAIWQRSPAEITRPSQALLGWLSDARRDLAFCHRTRRWREWPQALRLRWVQRQARRAGFQAGWSMHRELPEPERHHRFSPRRDAHFTVDGHGTLEEHLADACASIAAGVRGLVPADRLEGVLLGGGYGRGEGGVWRTPTGDRPYNDLEFYICIRGNRHLNELRYGRALHVLGEVLTPQVGVEIEFKITSQAEIAAGPVSMFSYDLCLGHRLVAGHPRLLFTHSHHEESGNIPLAEATRLLMNRCSGLLFAQAKLAATHFTPADADFVQRNIAKTELALGDAMLVVQGQYHWSVRERHRLVSRLARTERMPWVEAVHRHHSQGVAFKLHPYRSEATREELAARHRDVTELARDVWLWIEGRRLGTNFSSVRAYLAAPLRTWPGTSRLRNMLISLKIFGTNIPLDTALGCHPRTRVLHTLAAALWEPAAFHSPELLSRLQGELRTRANTVPAMLDAYRTLWRRVA